MHAQQDEIAQAYGLFWARAGQGEGHQIAVEHLVRPFDVAVGVDSTPAPLAASEP